MRSDYCEQFTGGHCEIIDAPASIDFCLAICKGGLTKEAREQKHGAEFSQAEGHSMPAIEPWRALCLKCPGPGGGHFAGSFFKACGYCLLIGINPATGKRVHLADWWKNGGECPLGTWPPIDKRDYFKGL